MDPEVAKQIYEMGRKTFEKLFGPDTPEFEDYLEQQEPIDMQAIMGPNTHITPHFRIDGKIALFKSVVRGCYEGRSIPFTKDDVFLTSFPKSGSTWVQMIMLHAIHDCDVEKVKQLNVDLEIPTLEMPECTLQGLKDRPSPRYIKTHLPYSMLPLGNCNRGYKIVHVTRNPKDLAVSLFHFYTMMKALAFVGDMDTIIKMFLNDIVMYAPFDQHCLGYWQHRNDDNVLFLKYEDLHKDNVAQIRKICAFIGKHFNEEQIQTIAKATSFEEMASNPKSHHAQWVEGNLANRDKFKFMRKGKVGDWKNNFNDETNQIFEDWIKARFEHSDITFDYD